MLTMRERDEMLARLRDALRKHYRQEDLLIENSGEKEMDFLRSYHNRFTGYWLDVLLSNRDEYALLAIRVDDEWYFEFPFQKIPTIHPE